MADKKSILKKVNAFFSSNNISAEAVEKFEDVKLIDGTTVLTAEPSLEVGSAVVITTADGTIPAPVGEYELEDGRIVVVMEEGVIGEIKEAATEETTEEVVEEPMAEQKQVNEKVKRLIERVEKESIFEKVAELTNKNETFAKSQEDKFKELQAKFDALQAFMKTTLETILDEPSKEPVVKVTNPFAKEKKQNIFKPNF